MQFTIDLLPSDIVGSEILDQAKGEFRTHKGPVFTNLLLADEINRAAPKVQSALLEAMQERRVTIGNRTYPLPAPFLVIATQNPIEQAAPSSSPKYSSIKLTVEVKATAKGLLPGFRDLFEFTPTGLKLDDIEDGGVAVARLSSEGELLAPASERRWLIKLTAEPGSEGTRSFKFPAPKSADLKVHYKRYQDADLVEVSPDLALAGLPLSSVPFWRWIALGTGGVAALGFFTFRRRQRSAAAAPKRAYSLPAVVTPFTTLQLLRDLSTDQRLAFTTEQREKLSQLVKDIEAFYFSRQRDAATAPNLDSIARDRIGRAQALAA